MSRVLVLGFDGLDYYLIQKWLKVLPNFKKLSEQGKLCRLNSIFPPDSIPAWISIYTGKNPSQHGVINFINPLNKKNELIITQVDNNYFKGNTIWDEVSSAGKKVCVVLPYAVYPAYHVNGVMVCRPLKTPLKNENFLSIYPECDIPHIAQQSLALSDGFPSMRHLDGFARYCFDRTKSESNLAEHLLGSNDWDFGFVYFSAIDAIEHTFWHYCDPGHKHYPGKNRYEDIIKSGYQVCDSIIGKLSSFISPDDYLMVVSDHGHAARPTRLLNVNVILKDLGYLHLNEKNNLLVDNDYIKNKAFWFVKKFGLPAGIVRLLQKFPFWKRYFASPNIIDWENTVAYTSDLSAIKTYCYGGIIINEQLLSNNIKPVVNNIISEMKDITFDGKKVVKWISERTELYDGKHVDKYPHIVLELEKDFGIGWGTNQLFSELEHNLQPGSHKYDSAVFACNRNDVPSPSSLISYKDIIGGLIRK